MQAQHKKLTRGFTIIEVMIVLAIAGLILAIIFLAVPALQRNSRNTALRNDAANILGGVDEFIVNNQGQLPTTVTCTAGTANITGAAGTAPSEAKIRGGTACNSTGTMPGAGVLGTISIAFNNKCNGNTGFQVANRAVAAGFRVENTGSADTTQCIET